MVDRQCSDDGAEHHDDDDDHVAKRHDAAAELLEIGDYPVLMTLLARGEKADAAML